MSSYWGSKSMHVTLSHTQLRTHSRFWRNCCNRFCHPSPELCKSGQGISSWVSGLTCFALHETETWGGTTWGGKTWGGTTSDLPMAGAGVNGFPRMEWDSCQLQWFPQQRLKGERKNLSLTGILKSGIQCNSHNMICPEIISHLPPIMKPTPKLTLSSWCISVSPNRQTTAWELSPWCHSHKQGQAVTSCLFRTVVCVPFLNERS